MKKSSYLILFLLMFFTLPSLALKDKAGWCWTGIQWVYDHEDDVAQACRDLCKSLVCIASVGAGAKSKLGDPTTTNTISGKTYQYYSGGYMEGFFPVLYCDCTDVELPPITAKRKKPSVKKEKK